MGKGRRKERTAMSWVVGKRGIAGMGSGKRRKEGKDDVAVGARERRDGRKGKQEKEEERKGRESKMVELGLSECRKKGNRRLM